MQSSKIASLIYHVSKNRGEALEFSRFSESNPLSSDSSNKDKSKPKVVFVKSQSEVKVISDSEKILSQRLRSLRLWTLQSLRPPSLRLMSKQIKL
jgi:hypothetical protein